MEPLIRLRTVPWQSLREYCTLSEHEMNPGYIRWNH